MALDLPLSESGRAALEVARLCAREAGRVVMARFGRDHEVRVKGRGNFVTDADLEAERVVLEILRAEYPQHTVLSEETRAEARAAGWMWVVDPLDGTHNFSQGIPLFCVNIALCHDGEPLLGLTFEPLREEEFLALKGEGLAVNGGPARASEVGSLGESLLALDLGYDDRRASLLISLLHELWPGVQGVRIIGSAALGLAYAASGRCDLFVHHNLYPWDVAAGIVQVADGAGAIADRDGGPASIYSEGVVAGAPAAVSEFLRAAKDKPWRE